MPEIQFTARINKSGSSQVITIPKSTREVLNLDAGTFVQVKLTPVTKESVMDGTNDKEIE